MWKRFDHIQNMTTDSFIIAYYAESIVVSLSKNRCLKINFNSTQTLAVLNQLAIDMSTPL